MQRDSVSATHMPLPNCAPEPEQALLQHLPMVRVLARRIHDRLPRSVDIYDLYSAGLVGLIEASTKFNPAKEVRFASYANFRVRGAILDSLRVSDWAPRALRRKERKIHDAIRSLTFQLGHPPEEEEIAAELKISLDDYQHLLGYLDSLEIGMLHREREDGSSEEEEVYVPDPPENNPLLRCMKGEMAKRLAAAIQNLPGRERQVTTLYYYEEMTMAEIGLALGLHPTRVMRIRTSAMLHLRTALSDLSPRQSVNPTPIRSHVVKRLEHAFMPKPAA
jgi:RNA polymerase sigma factor FliA